MQAMTKSAWNPWIFRALGVVVIVVAAKLAARDWLNDYVGMFIAFLAGRYLLFYFPPHPEAAAPDSENSPDRSENSPDHSEKPPGHL